MATPVTDALILLFSAINETDYRGEGRTLEHVGLAGLSPDGIVHFLEEGLSAADRRCRSRPCGRVAIALHLEIFGTITHRSMGLWRTTSDLRERGTGARATAVALVSRCWGHHGGPWS